MSFLQGQYHDTRCPICPTSAVGQKFRFITWRVARASPGPLGPKRDSQVTSFWGHLWLGGDGFTFAGLSFVVFYVWNVFVS